METKFKIKGDYHPYAISCDRSEAQIQAIEQIFPDTHIVYCKRHLLANIKKNAEKYYHITSLFLKGIISEVAYKNKIEDLNNELKESAINKNQEETYQKQYNYINDLCSKPEHWFPRYLIGKGLYEKSIRTSNGIESFFSGLKNYLQHKKSSIDRIFAAFMFICIKKLKKLIVIEDKLNEQKRQNSTMIEELKKRYHYPSKLIASVGKIGFYFFLQQLNENCDQEICSNLELDTFSK